MFKIMNNNYNIIDNKNNYFIILNNYLFFILLYKN